MKKITLLLAVLTTLTLTIRAQNLLEFELKPNEKVEKELTLEGFNPTEELKIMLKVEMKIPENSIYLTFDRKTVSENDTYLLFFPMLSAKTSIPEVVDCKLHKKLLWSKDKKLLQGSMNYFLQSENLIIEDKDNCFRSLANNNEDEFSYELKDTEEDFTIELVDLYVAITQKKPWYSFSKKDKKLLFKVAPTTLRMVPEKKPKEAEKCEIEKVVVPYIEAQYAAMQTEAEALLDALKKQNCTVFSLLHDKIRRTFVMVNDKCEKYSDCEKVAQAIKLYNEEVEKLLSEKCNAPAPQPGAACNMSESELTAINAMLRNLQMKINVKKKDGQSTTEERKELQSIVESFNPKLTAECRRKYKGLVDAYTNYCTVISGLF